MKTQIQRWQKKGFKILELLVLMCLLTFIWHVPVSAAETDATAQDTEIPVREPTNTTDNANDDFQLNISSNAGSTSLSSTLQILMMITILSIAPSILLMVTSFTRIVIVLHFVRSALGTQTTPPNQVLIGLALFLTFFIMSPVFTQINDNAIKPLSEGTITQEEAIEAGLAPIREFMYQQTNTKDIKLFLEIADMTEQVQKEDDIPTTVLIPSFMINELRKAFTMGFVIYLPFLVIDMVVASTLMSMGMMMLPPTTISMPFKILLFIMADGWNLVIGELVKTFYT
ncbi:MAG: flagellar type III secretion system pore protein FliP [Velocimicrobium sp.]